jgi:hypothetical protein
LLTGLITPCILMLGAAPVVKNMSEASFSDISFK